MKKILLLLITILFISCESIDSKYVWYSPQEVIEKSDQLLPGDILILSKGSKFKEMWGHSVIINAEGKVVEFPGYFSGYHEFPLYSWSTLDRKIAIFRLKGIDDDFRDHLMQEIGQTINKKYGLTFDKDFDKRLYCSQFVYDVFKKAGITTGRMINLDSNNGSWVMPFDIMRSDQLENITLK
ncbi:MAG: hypothetical protein KBF12_10100 [Sebaldella sp.]|nr:hypothetical protein [Sebaldella sp.]